MAPRVASIHKPKLEVNRAQTAFTCPDCHGTIWEVNENGEIRYECRVGHTYSPEGMSQAEDEDVERSLWVALRTLEESAALDERLAEVAGERKRSNAYKLFHDKAEQRRQHASVLREFLVGSKRRHTQADGSQEATEELEHVS